MTGKIMKGIGGFYYVYVEGSGLYECRARGIFRNKKMKPNVGDVVDIDILSEEEKTGNLVKIHKRKNQLIRPMAANVDQALVIFAVHEPEPNFHLLNRFLITMEQQEIPVSICFSLLIQFKVEDFPTPDGPAIIVVLPRRSSSICVIPSPVAAAWKIT